MQPGAFFREPPATSRPRSVTVPVGSSPRGAIVPAGPSRGLWPLTIRVEMHVLLHADAVVAGAVGGGVGGVALLGVPPAGDKAQEHRAAGAVAGTLCHGRVAGDGAGVAGGAGIRVLGGALRHSSSGSLAAPRLHVLHATHVENPHAGNSRVALPADTAHTNIITPKVTPPLQDPNTAPVHLRRPSTPSSLPTFFQALKSSRAGRR